MISRLHSRFLLSKPLLPQSACILLSLIIHCSLISTGHLRKSAPWSVCEHHTAFSLAYT